MALTDGGLRQLLPHFVVYQSWELASAWDAAT